MLSFRPPQVVNGDRNGEGSFGRAGVVWIIALLELFGKSRQLTFPQKRMHYVYVIEVAFHKSIDGLRIKFQSVV